MTYDLGTLVSCFKFPKCRVSQDNQLSAEPFGSQWQETRWWSEPGREECQWMCLWELTSRILGPSEGSGEHSKGRGAALVLCYFWGSHTNILSSFVLSICMSPFGLQSIFCCHKKTVSHSWRSWDGGNEAAAPVPSVLRDPSPVTDKKAWSTSQNIWLEKHISDATFKFIYLSFHLKLGRLTCSQYLSKEVSGNNDSPYRKVSTTFTEEHHKLRYLFQTQKKRVDKELSHVTKSALTRKHNTHIK